MQKRICFRWLLANKRNKEARKILERYAKSKGTNLTEITWKRILETEESKVRTLFEADLPYFHVGKKRKLSQRGLG